MGPWRWGDGSPVLHMEFCLTLDVSWNVINHFVIHTRRNFKVQRCAESQIPPRRWGGGLGGSSQRALQIHITECVKEWRYNYQNISPRECGGMCPAYAR